MNSHRLPVLLIASLVSTGAVANPTPLAVSATTSAIVRSSSGGMRQADQLVDLVKHSIGEVDFDNPKIVRPRRQLDDDELAALLKAWQSIPAQEAEKPSVGPPPGGHLSYTVRDKNGSSRLLAGADGAPAGARYVVLTNDQLSALGAVWPGLAAKTPPPVPPSLEHSVKLFLIEALFGPPGGKREVAKSLARLDPGSKHFVFHDVRSPDAVLGIQLTPAKKTTLRLKELATELELEQPIAVLVNAEHQIWMLGDKTTGKPLSKWRAAELEVRLNMPAKLRGAGVQQASLEGASVTYVILRLKKELSE